MFELTTTRPEQRANISATDNYRRPGAPAAPIGQTGRDQISPSLNEVLGLLKTLESAA